MFIILSPTQQYSSKSDSVIQWCLVPLLSFLKVWNNESAKTFKSLQLDSNLEPISSSTNTQPLDQTPSSKGFLDIQATIDCAFTLKRVRNMTKRYSRLKSLFLLKNKKLRVIYSKQDKTLLLLKLWFGLHMYGDYHSYFLLNRE